MGMPLAKPPSEWAGARPLGDDVYWPPFENKTIIWHWCKRDRLDNEPRWTNAATTNHQHPSFNPLHLEPSLACADCSWHGFVRDGRSVAV